MKRQEELKHDLEKMAVELLVSFVEHYRPRTTSLYIKAVVDTPSVVIRYFTVSLLH